MSRRGENIRKRKDGRWEGRYLVIINNTKKYKSVYGHTYSQVKEKLKKVDYENKQIINKTSLTFKDVSEQWVQINQLRLK